MAPKTEKKVTALKADRESQAFAVFPAVETFKDF